MVSFKCSKCSFATTRSYNLRRHLKDVHGIHANTSFERGSQIPAGIPEEIQYEEELQYPRINSHQPRMDPEEYFEEEEEDEPRINPVDGLYSKEEREKIRDALKRTKCQILDCVLNILPPSLKAEAKRICDLTRDNDRIWIINKNEVILDGRVIPKSNIYTLIIEELMKCLSPINTKQYEKENKLLKYLSAHQTKALERVRVCPYVKNSNLCLTAL